MNWNVKQIANVNFQTEERKEKENRDSHKIIITKENNNIKF